MATTKETTSSTEASEETLKWPLPFNVSVDKLDKIIRGFFQEGADNKPVSASSIAKLSGLNAATVKANSKFLKALGVLKTEEGKDVYSFEAKGAEYAKALATNRISEAAPILKELLQNSSLKELVGFVELNKASGDLNYESLFTQIKAFARVKDNPKFPRGVSHPYSTGIKTLIGLLIRAGIAPQNLEESKKPVTLKIPKTGKPKPTVEMPPLQIVESQATTPTTKATIEKSFLGQAPSLPFAINISVEANDPESIKELINLIRELRQQPQSQ